MSTQLRQRLSGIIATLFIFMSLATLSGRIIPSAFADSPDILAELTEASDFNAADYPLNDKLMSIQVIQIAESADGKLLVYTYQPNADPELHASSIKISRKAENPNDHNNYALEFVACSCVFFKYIVKGFELETCSVRYYNVSSILRPFIQGYDAPPAVGSISEIPYAVGKLYTAVDDKNTVKYFCKVVEVISVTDKYVGFCRFKDGVDFYGMACEEMTDAHFVSFSCDRPIDQLKSIRLNYVEQPAQGYFCFDKMCTKGHPYAEPFDISPTSDPSVERSDVVIKADDTMHNTADYFGMYKAPSYSWKCIQKTWDFLDEFGEIYEYETEELDAIGNTDWTVFFASTNVFAVTGSGTIVATALVGPIFGSFLGALAGAYETNCQVTQIENVTLLDLEYEYDGKTYNMGVVDNKQTGSGDPINKLTPADIPGYVWAIIAVIAVIGLIVLFVACPQVFSLLVQGLTFLIQKLVEFFIWFAGLIASLFHKDGGGA